MISKAVSEHYNARSEHNQVLSMPANEELRMSSVGNRSHRIVIESDSDEEEAEIVENVEKLPRHRMRKDSSSRKVNKKRLMGNTRFRGGDRIYPSNFCFVFVTALMIAIPSAIVGVLTNYALTGWVGCWFLGIAYFISTFNTLRVLHLCSSTEPGIIPKIRSKEIAYNK